MMISATSIGHVFLQGSDHEVAWKVSTSLTYPDKSEKQPCRSDGRVGLCRQHRNGEDKPRYLAEFRENGAISEGFTFVLSRRVHFMDFTNLFVLPLWSGGFV